MSSKIIQFQKGMSLLDFLSHFGNEDQCRDAIITLKWPNGFVCRKCKHVSGCWIKSRKTFQCNKCHSQESPIAHTIWQGTNLPLTKWFLAIYLLSQSKNGISALELKRQIGVSYDTAWNLKHKIMQVMKEKEDARILSGNVQVDDAYLGGKRSGKRGRGAAGKTPIIAAVQTDSEGNPELIKLRVVNELTMEQIKIWAQLNLNRESNITVDGWRSYANLESMGFNLTQLKMDNPKINPNSKQFHWVNTVLSNLKTSLASAYKHHERKYSQRYLSEFEYRFNRRFDLSTISNKLFFAAVHTPPMTRSILTLAVND